MKNIKKLFLLTALLAVIVCAFSLGVSAKQSGTCGAKLTWTLSDDGVLTISGEGKMTNWNSNSFVPWYSYRESILSVVIGDGVTSIGEYAFYNCTGLTSIEIPDSVTSIEDSAFANCIGLTSIEIPDSVTSVGDYAFNTCSGLTSIKLPESVTSIGDYYTFAFCTGLTSIEIPDGVTSIGDGAFHECTGLTSIEIPNSVTSIGGEAFAYCTGLTSIEIPDSVTSIGQSVFYECLSLESIEIPDSVTSIYYGAFSGCNDLTTIYYNGTKEQWNSVEIGGRNDPILNAEIIFLAKEGAQGTFGTNITWTLSGDGVLTISGEGEMGTGYFWWFADDVPWYSYRESILSVVIEDGVTSIGDYAFYECTGLTSIEIPDSVTSIGIEAFYFCTGLTSIEIPDSVMGIGSMAFSGCGITSIEIPDSVTSIGSWAFSDCTGLTSIKIPESVTSIWNGAFENCTGLTSIEIPDSVTVIVDDAFNNCPNLTIYGYADSIAESYAIYKNIPFSVVNIKTYGDLKYEVSEGEVTITGCKTSVTGELVIPSTIDGYPVTSIGDFAFANCIGLTSIEIPDGVTSIGEGAFSSCSSLTSIKIPDGVTSIEYGAFSGCYVLTNIEIPDSVTSIGDRAFAVCYCLKSIEIPDGVTSIGEGAFYECLSLESIKIPDSVTSIGFEAFFGCTGLTSIEIPDSVMSIENGAFNYCQNLTVYGYEGSNAQKYANENSIPFKRIPQVTVNGKMVAFPDQKPVIEDGRTLVPARGVFEALGATVSWDDSTKTAIVKTDEKEIAVQIGRNYLVVNGKMIEIDVPAKIINGRTMIPLRAVAEALDCEVGWDAATYTATIKSK